MLLAGPGRGERDLRLGEGWRRADWPTRFFLELACSSPSACSPPACERADGLGWGRTGSQERRERGQRRGRSVRLHLEPRVKVESGRGERGTRARLVI